LDDNRPGWYETGVFSSLQAEYKNPFAEYVIRAFSGRAYFQGMDEAVFSDSHGEYEIPGTPYDPT